MVTKGFVTPFFALCILFISHNLFAASDDEVTEFSYTPLLEGQLNYQTYLNSLGIAQIRSVRQSSDDNQRHWVDILDHNNKRLKRFSDNYSVNVRGQGRYKNAAMLFVTSTRKECKKDCTRHYLFGSNVRQPKLRSSLMGSTFSTLVLKNTDFLSINEDGLLIQNVKNGAVQHIKAPIKLTDGTIGNNIDGNWQAVAVGENGEVMVANMNGWRDLKLNISAHGDRSGILSIYPQTKNKALVAIYRFINEYNKGLYVLDYNFQSEQINDEGWLFNSEINNIGFDPDIYFHQAFNDVVVSSINSSDRDSNVYFRIPASQMSGLEYFLPDHVQNSGFIREKSFSFMIGGSISKTSWASQSEVEMDGTTYGKADYEIADSLFTSSNIEARFGNTSLTINYLQNRTEDVTNTGTSGLAKEASRYLFSSLDFQGLLSPSSSLRLLLEQGKTNGIAKINIDSEAKETLNFTSKYNRFGLLSMQERGAYVGFDYINYSMPSVVGFSDNDEDIVFTTYDSGLELSSIRFLAGYDTLAYAKRYETDFSQWYYSGGMNLGLGWADLSNDVISRAKAETGKNDVAETPLFFILGGELELGHLWQKRSKKFNGLGYSMALGYKLNLNYLYGTPLNDEEDTKSLYLEFSKWDAFHGPFFKANVIF